MQRVVGLAILAIACLCLELMPMQADAAPTVQREVSLENSDPRIDRPVSIKLGKGSLSEAVSLISRATGASITAARTIRDDPAVVVVTGRPAREVMTEIARWFDLSWEVSSKGGNYQYLLIESAHRRQDLLAKTREDASRMWDALKRQIQRERASSTSGTPAPVLEFVSNLSRNDWDSLIAGMPLYFSTSGMQGTRPMSPAVVQQLMPREPQFSETARRMKGFHFCLWLEPPGNFRPLKLTMRRVAVRAAGDAVSDVDLGSWNVSVDYYRPKPKPTPLADVARVWSDDATLNTKRRFAFRVDDVAPGAISIRQYTIYRPIAEQYGVNLIADGFWMTGDLPGVKIQKELPLYEVLNTYVEPNAAWEKHNSYICIRSHTWYHDRDVEVPADLLRKWSARLRQSRRFSLDDVTSLAITLRDEQLEYFDVMIRDYGISCDAFYMCFNEGGREILRTYGSLADAQRRSLLRGETLRYEELSPTAKRWLQAAYTVRQKLFPFHAPPGGPQWGIISLANQSVERVASEIDERHIVVQFRALDGPSAGKVIYRGQIGGKYSDPVSANDIPTQVVQLLHVYDDQHRAPFKYPIPSIYVFPTLTPGGEQQGKPER